MSDELQTNETAAAEAPAIHGFGTEPAEGAIRFESPGSDLYVHRPSDIVNLAEQLAYEEVTFEVMASDDGTVVLSARHDNEDIADATVRNGPEVLGAVDELVRNAATEIGVA